MTGTVNKFALAESKAQTNWTDFQGHKQLILFANILGSKLLIGEMAE